MNAFNNCTDMGMMQSFLILLLENAKYFWLMAFLMKVVSKIKTILL